MSLKRQDAYQSALQEARKMIARHIEIENRLFVYQELIPALRQAEYEAKKQCQ